MPSKCTVCGKRPPREGRKLCEHCRSKRQAHRERIRAALLTQRCDCGEAIADIVELACARCVFLDGHSARGDQVRPRLDGQVIEILRHEGEQKLQDIAQRLNLHVRSVLRALHDLERKGRVTWWADDECETGLEKHWRLVDIERPIYAPATARNTPGRSWQAAVLRPLGFSRAA